MSLRNPNTLISVPNDETFDFLFKIVLIGDCGTGKTCVVQRFKTGQYEERHGNTIGVDFSMKTISINGKKIKVNRTIHNDFISHTVNSVRKENIKKNVYIPIQIQLWDTAGQERFRTITQSYYRSANGVIIGNNIFTTIKIRSKIKSKS